LFCALSLGLVYISNANPACSCVYICKFQFRPIHPPSRRLSTTKLTMLRGRWLGPRAPLISSDEKNAWNHGRWRLPGLTHGRWPGHWECSRSKLQGDLRGKPISSLSSSSQLDRAMGALWHLPCCSLTMQI
jgi:hypothetical protein